jgi:hypothetical protein
VVKEEELTAKRSRVQESLILLIPLIPLILSPYTRNVSKASSQIEETRITKVAKMGHIIKNT